MEIKFAGAIPAASNFYLYPKSAGKMDFWKRSGYNGEKIM